MNNVQPSYSNSPGFDPLTSIIIQKSKEEELVWEGEQGEKGGIKKELRKREAAIIFAGRREELHEVANLLNPGQGIPFFSSWNL